MLNAGIGGRCRRLKTSYRDSTVKIASGRLMSVRSQACSTGRGYASLIKHSGGTVTIYGDLNSTGKDLGDRPGRRRERASILMASKRYSRAACLRHRARDGTPDDRRVTEGGGAETRGMILDILQRHLRSADWHNGMPSRKDMRLINVNVPDTACVIHFVRRRRCSTSH